MRSRNQTVCITVIISLVLVVAFVNPNPVDSTKPSDIRLTFDYGTQILTVNVSHYVANTKTHYIENLEILKNGLSILNRSYVNQSINWGMHDTFSVSAVVDDNLTVIAICSKGYLITSWLIVTSTTATNQSPTETITTTEPTDGPETSLGTGPAVAVGIAVVVFFIIFFAWLNPERVPEPLKQLGSRIRSGFERFGETLSTLFQQIKTKVTTR